MPKLLRQSPGKCHLCMLPIPENIVSPIHPLFGTIDHDQPLSRGGKDRIYNRLPAHRLCNKIKGNAWPVPAYKRVSMVQQISGELRKFGIAIGRKRINQIKGEIMGNADHKYDALPDILRWEDDGGTTFIRPPWRMRA